MAKSKTGGTRSYIRGRVGADVYSIGKDAKGAKQQVVRSLAETVANPQTVAQMTGRMIMSTVMQAVSVMKPIIDHSFDGVPKGQPSISEFISRNYALIKADVAAHPSSGNSFQLNGYGVKGMRTGYYIVSNGQAVVPAGIEFSTNHSNPRVAVGAEATFGTLKAAWGMNSEEYLTLFSFKYPLDPQRSPDSTKGLILYTARLSIKEGLADATVLTAENAASCFNIEGNVVPEFDLSEGKLIIKVATDVEQPFYGQVWHIVSRKNDAQFIHSRCVLDGTIATGYAADDILPTYPVGAEMYLDGGDL